ncbi:HNH endonuclease [Citricoccus zhacaiensis]|uniref:HNH endonuclease n=1 Tax=Citricoccus zhacaiensis TaxID=489142 RepID=A0ABQ2MBC8_9MICC|nr:HNH endonuclease [Citricoccus zhacaiensis]GGO49559.1 HNH endonuclease [Citricoccus zhacaiensis]
MAEPVELRKSAIAWLKERTSDGLEPLTREDILDFTYQGEPFVLQSTQQGIRKPRDFEAALSFQTVYRPPGQKRPYEDDIGADGLIRYVLRGDNPNHPENRGLRQAMELQLPLIWFVGVAMVPARFQVVSPVYIVREEVELKRFALAPVNETDMLPEMMTGSAMEESLRRYLRRETKIRLHQPVFRSTVLIAYENHCAVCNLAHPQLLDAAHIVPDREEFGIASVVDGMAMCKIHHAAFDGCFLGIRPDHVVQIREDLLDEVDGPMLRHGLQELHGKRLMALPKRNAERPRHDLLEKAFERFRSKAVDGVA